MPPTPSAPAPAAAAHKTDVSSPNANSAQRLDQAPEHTYAPRPARRICPPPRHQRLTYPHRHF
eukprot:5092103-Prymnesium_polylepis.1